LDPFDGLMVQGLREYEGKVFRNVDDPSLELPRVPEPEEKVEGQAQPGEAELAPLVARVKTVLGDRVSEVRASALLTGSPCRLVSTGSEYDRDLQRVRRLLEEDYKPSAKILELNPRHPIIRNLADLAENHAADARIEPAIEQLFDDLLLLEGLHPNPAAMVPRIQALLEAATRPGG
jgi:molecular chaperone HtpG